MILSQINRYLRQHGQANSMDIALHFGVAPDALKGMLELLQEKGRIRPVPAQVSSCGSTCCKCAVNNCGSEMWEPVLKH